MTDADRPAFARLLAVLSETFNEPVSEIRADAYFVALAEHPIGLVTKGAAIVGRGNFFPRPGEWIAAVPTLCKGGCGRVGTCLSAIECRDYYLSTQRALLESQKARA